MNYKIGDKLRIIDCIAGHGFEIGTIVEVIEVFPESEDPHYEVKSKYQAWFVEDNEVKLVEEGENV